MDGEGYGMVCSQLTLQSDKRGFFLQFADNVVATAGPEWLQTFSQIRSDKKKLELCFSTPRVREAIDTTLTNIQPLNRSKSAWLSQLRRQDAQQAMTKSNLNKALLLANQAVVRAPKPGIEKEIDDGLSLSQALWIRSQILRRKKDWQRALGDLQLAVKHQLKSDLKCDAYLKMSECYMALGSVDKAKISLEVWKRFGGDPTTNKSVQALMNDIETVTKAGGGTVKEAQTMANKESPLDKGCSLAGGRHKVFSGCSSKLEVRQREGAGREMVAGTPLRVGDVVAKDEPYGSCLLIDRHGSHCLNCFDRLDVIECCGDCSGVAYCSSRCATEGAAYHRYECKHLELLIGSGMSVLCFLALRMVTQNSLKYFQDAYTKLGDKNFNHPYAKIWRLEGHSDKRDPKSYLHRTLMAIFLLYILRQTDYFGTKSEVLSDLSEGELLIAEVLLKHLQVLQYNAHEIYETLCKSKTSIKHTKTNYIGIAVYPCASLFNHDCQATVARYFEGKSIVLRLIRPLKKGDVVAENYGPVYTMRTKDQRQKSLLARYLFTCVCQACQEDWPRLEDMTDDLPVNIRCDGAKCNKTFLHPGKPESKVKCRSCGTRTNVHEKYLLVRSLSNEFESAVNRMETGETDMAETLLTAYVERTLTLAAPPLKTLALAQEALRSCWASKFNMHIVS